MHLSTTEIKKLLKNWHFYRASITSSEDGGELKRKLDAVEKSLSVLDDISKAIIKMRYFEKIEMEIVASRVYMTRQAVHKRIVKAQSEMMFFIANTV